MIRKIMPLLLLSFVLGGCDKRDKEFHDKPIVPPIGGIWAGSVQVNGVATAIKLILIQGGALVQGTYTADGATNTLGTSGSVTGATTGPAFSLNVTSDAPACSKGIQLGGANSGTELSFNMIGTDCHDGALRGESSLKKQP